MAMADSVPGVSGGTIAFLLGFYDEFINSLNDLMGKDNARRKQAFFFLFKLGVGWVAGFCLSVLVLSGLFQEHIYEISSVFMGLTFFAVPMVIREEKDSIRGRYGNLVFTVLGIGLVFCISYFNPAGGQGMNVSVEHLSMGLVAYVFLTAMVAITAMVLPGISGSTLLLIFGIYVPIIGAVKELLHMNLNYVPILLVFGMGVITGIVGIIKTIKMCLERYRSQTIYAILGLMIGSLYAITKGPTTLDVPMEPLGLQTFSILFFLLGGLILAGLEVLKTRLEK
ncbi:DUF368 domain-containing protein [Enterocloster aldensis]|jgi:putative membrane protein|uniref:DUF368 domain-containing protein n=2 Tax=Enterocloster aldenensis TaxID=358742 RepID=A0AAW5BT81_9FIRM|nr:DUF368 domain-containing protein [uncultured Lachnoclostridium sp.]MBS1457629.1 DUF368 domain-containing protein [Clostridium sp.]MBS5628540.1 DUF368 domain-containing protein [Clostridiales bacterium]MCB7333883.1 DUF368 domain-containing protein [Enterocloster aldenensis]MCC3393710.1 DUF368 domain-containing protein [Clostridiales bacterium AHG0011]RGC63917.1 DUF368 domain-containing protein [Dorea longicatena]